MKLRAILKSKIHRAVVTGADIDYVGSVGVDQDLLDRTDIIPGERVAIWNINNGIRIDTYAISLPRGSGQIVINGAAARHFHPGDKVIIVAFCLTDEPIEPKMIAVDEQNRFIQDLVPNGSPEDFHTVEADLQPTVEADLQPTVEADLQPTVGADLQVGPVKA